MAQSMDKNGSATLSTRASIVLVLPVMCLLLVFFAYPLVELLRQSFYAPQLSLANYVQALTNELYVGILLRTLWFAAVVTVLTLLLGYPVALTMSRLSGAMAVVVGACVMVPLWTSVLVRAYAWIVLLQRNGLVNGLLTGMGLTDHPLQLIYTQGTVILATVHVLLPFMILSVYGVLRTIPVDLSRAAASLGARPFAIFRHVVLPLSLPGVYSGVVMVFIISLGFYITPALLGGPRSLLMSTLIGQQTTETLNWGLAGALSVTLLVITLVVVGIFGRLIRLESKGG
ncbi:MAG: ABC transporter permease [Ramlibacter sp.]